MFIGFSVSNFMSFKETQTMSMIAAKTAGHRNHILSGNRRRILRTALVFGANAGGKSNFIRAIHFSREIILEGMEAVDVSRKYFRISGEGYRLPGVFEYRLAVESGSEYSYGIAVSYVNKEILSEWLVRVEPDGTEICIFNRMTDDAGKTVTETEVRFNDQDEENRMRVYLEDFCGDMSGSLKKKSILNDIAERSNGKRGIFSEITGVYQWFQNMIIIFPTSQYGGLNQLAQKAEVRDFFSRILKYLDTGIEQVESRKGEIDFEKIFEGIPKEEAEKLKIGISNTIQEDPVIIKVNNQVYSLSRDDQGKLITVKMLQNHGNDQDLFEYADESDGTKRLFDLIPLFYLREKNKVIFIDEIDRSLHSNLTRKFLELFYHLTEHDSCQMIATTHDTSLMDLELVRQDEIWFIERLADQSSHIYSLNRYKGRQDERPDREYLLGRYHAVPVFDDEILEEANDEPIPTDFSRL